MRALYSPNLYHAVRNTRAHTQTNETAQSEKRLKEMMSSMARAAESLGQSCNLQYRGPQYHIDLMKRIKKEVKLKQVEIKKLEIIKRAEAEPISAQILPARQAPSWGRYRHRCQSYGLASCLNREPVKHFWIILKRRKYNKQKLFRHYDCLLRNKLAHHPSGMQAANC